MFDLKLVAFGNSVFDFHFFRRPETSPDAVDEIGADVAIAQTVERFALIGPPSIRQRAGADASGSVNRPPMAAPGT